MVPVYRIFTIVTVTLLVFTVTAPSQGSVGEKASGEQPSTKKPEERTSAVKSEEHSGNPRADKSSEEQTSHKPESAGVSEASKEDQGGKWVFISNEELKTLLENMNVNMSNVDPVAGNSERTSGTEEKPIESNKEANEDHTSVKTTKATAQPE